MPNSLNYNITHHADIHDLDLNLKGHDMTDYKTRSYQVGEHAHMLTVSGDTYSTVRGEVISIDYEHDRPHYIVKTSPQREGGFTSQAICIFEKRSFEPDGVIPEGADYVTYLIPTEDDPVVNKVSEQLARKRVKYWAKEIQSEMEGMEIKVANVHRSVNQIKVALGWLEKTLKDAR